MFFQHRGIPGIGNWGYKKSERETGLEPATFSLATRRSTTELLPQNAEFNYKRRWYKCKLCPTLLF